MVAVDSDHGHCSHSQVFLRTAPQPHEPEALDQTWHTLASLFGMMDTPFHSLMNELHQGLAVLLTCLEFKQTPHESLSRMDNLACAGQPPYQ